MQEQASIDSNIVIEMLTLHLKSPKVFISYSDQDSDAALIIATRLRQKGVNAWLDIWEFVPGEPMQARIEEAIASSDFVLVLLSPQSVNSERTKDLIGGPLSRELKSRAINVFPALIADCEIPSGLATIGYLDLRKDFDSAIDTMVRRFHAGREIDFAEIDHYVFQSMTRDLLSALGFHNIEMEFTLERTQFDIKADYYTDPFNPSTRETWLVEVKLYRNSRVDIDWLKKFTNRLTAFPSTYRWLIVTNGQLTSISKGWLAEEEKRTGTRIRVVDGVEFKALLLRHPTIVTRYFVKSGDQEVTA